MAKICDVQPVNTKIKQVRKSLPHKTQGCLNSEEGEIASGQGSQRRYNEEDAIQTKLLKNA